MGPAAAVAPPEGSRRPPGEGAVAATDSTHRSHGGGEREEGPRCGARRPPVARAEPAPGGQDAAVEEEHRGEVGADYGGGEGRGRGRRAAGCQRRRRRLAGLPEPTGRGAPSRSPPSPATPRPRRLAGLYVWWFA
ncbi:hypothetical protein GUJ93_ZPchr0003g17628 [Zizania palustris]|uniref:Uncharacterized protein n=1 Tax=Zizania palustris TaxID=103762 RepID=A0A8J5RXP7_ZIZPA|nr:hypothetical protein GUJ93_ZPchr0003g17628 [Zizania palustris]